LAELEDRLRQKDSVEASLEDGVLALHISGVEALRAYVSKEEGPFVLAQWRHVLRSTNLAAVSEARNLVKSLLQLRWSDNATLRDQTNQLDAEISLLEEEILATETELHELLYDLYELAAEDKALVQKDWRTRPLT